MDKIFHEKALLMFIFFLFSTLASAEVIFSGSLSKNKHEPNKAIYSDYIRPEHKDFHADKLLLVMRARNIKHCEYKLNIKGANYTSSIKLNRGVFYKGAVQATPDDLYFYDTVTKTEFDIHFFGGQHFDKVGGASIRTTCLKEKTENCTDFSDVKYEFDAVCLSENSKDTPVWKPLVVGRTIKDTDLLPDRDSKYTSKVIWDGEYYSKSKNINQQNMDEMKPVILDLDQSKSCKFRLRLVEWGANVTQIDSAITNIDYAFGFKGPSFVSTNDTIYNYLPIYDVKLVDKYRKGTGLVFYSVGQKKYRFDFLFIYEKKKSALESIDVESSCVVGGDRDDPSKACSSRFHYFSLEYSCPK